MIFKDLLRIFQIFLYFNFQDFFEFFRTELTSTVTWLSSVLKSSSERATIFQSCSDSKLLLHDRIASTLSSPSLILLAASSISTNWSDPHVVVSAVRCPPFSVDDLQKDHFQGFSDFFKGFLIEK